MRRRARSARGGPGSAKARRPIASRTRAKSSGRCSAMLPPITMTSGFSSVDEAGAQGADAPPRHGPGSPGSRRRPRRRHGHCCGIELRSIRRGRARASAGARPPASAPPQRGRCAAPEAIASTWPAAPSPQSGPSSSTVTWPSSPAVPSATDQRPAVEDDAAADPGRDGDVDRVAGAAGRAVAPLGHDRDVRVPLEEGRHAEGALRRARPVARHASRPRFGGATTTPRQGSSGPGEEMPTPTGAGRPAARASAVDVARRARRSRSRRHRRPPDRSCPLPGARQDARSGPT